MDSVARQPPVMSPAFASPNGSVSTRATPCARHSTGRLP